MPRSPGSCQALTIGQLARRWGVGVERIRQLVHSGLLPGAFTIPSAGRYGATLKIPLATVIQVETEDWALIPQGKQTGPKPSRRKDDSGPALKHFPKLAASPEPVSGSPEDAGG
jgi:hypothetical protein